MTEPSTGGWSKTARWLHWLVAVMIVTQLAIGWYADRLPISPDKIQWMTGHKSLGITILAFVLLRLAWRLTHRPPEPVEHARWAVLASRAAHAALYILMLAVPLSGWMAASTSRLPWKLWWQWPFPRLAEADKAAQETWGTVHEWLMWALLTLVLVHIAAALRHHFVLKDRVLTRMWRGGP